MSEENVTPLRTSVQIQLDMLAKQIALQGGASGGGGGAMDSRVDHLEVRVGRIETKLDTILDRISAIATKSDMRNYLLTGVALFIAIVGLLIAGMGWLETRAARVQAPPASPSAPIVLELPAPAARTK